jgi:hypothetical protein
MLNGNLGLDRDKTDSNWPVNERILARDQIRK